MAFHFSPLSIPDVIKIETDIHKDQRGHFAEVFKRSDFVAQGLPGDFVQFNHSKSVKNVLRGLHYQLNPKAQGKLVSVTSGEIVDVAVDIRKNSPTYGKWVSATLSSKSKNMLYIPAGFAHGFCVTSETAEMLYFCTELYSPEHERGIIWNDPTLNIAWPTNEPITAEKDAAFPSLAEAENNFV